MYTPCYELYSPKVIKSPLASSEMLNTNIPYTLCPDLLYRLTICFLVEIVGLHVKRGMYLLMLNISEVERKYLLKNSFDLKSA